MRLVARQDPAAANAALTEMRTLEDAAWPAIRLQRGAEAELIAAYDNPHQALERAYRLMALEEEAKSGMLHGLACVVDIELCQCHAEAVLRGALELVSRLEGTRYRRTLTLRGLACFRPGLLTTMFLRRVPWRRRGGPMPSCSTDTARSGATPSLCWPRSKIAHVLARFCADL